MVLVLVLVMTLLTVMTEQSTQGAGHKPHKAVNKKE